MPSQCDAGFAIADIVAENRDYFISSAKPKAMSGYISYACPHPLTGLSGSCDPNTAGQTGYNVGTGP